MTIAGRFVLIWLVFLGVTLGGSAALFWLLDPYHLRRDVAETARHWMPSQSRVAVAYQLAEADARALVIGTSRVMAGIEPSHTALARTHGRVFKAALPGASFFELSAYVRHALVRNELAQVLVFVDFGSFYRHPLPISGFDPERLLSADAPGGLGWQIAYRTRETLLTGAALRASVGAATGTELEPGLSGPPCDRRAGFRRADRGMWRAYQPLGASSQSPDDARGRRRVHVRAQAQHQYNTNLDAVRTLLEAIARTSATLYVVIEPVHARRLEILHALGLWPRYEQWKRDLNAALERAPSSTRPVEFWDFGDYSDATLEPADECPQAGPALIHYYESSHFTPVLGAMVLERILGAAGEAPSAHSGFGRRLTSENIEAHLAEVRARRERFVKRFPESLPANASGSPGSKEEL